jgi:hypothetical protein
MTVSEQRLGKHVPAETNMHETIEEWCLRYDLRRGVYKEENWGNQAVDG